MRRKLDKDLAAVPEVDWARLAAYIDGEGCIIITPKRSGRGQHMKVFVANTDVRLMEWLRDTFGGTVHGKKRTGEHRAKHRPCYVWTICSQVAWMVLLCCKPYFIVKRDQCDVALAFQRTMTRKRKWVGYQQRAHVPQATQVFRDHCFDELKRLKHQDFAPLDSPLTH